MTRSLFDRLFKTSGSIQRTLRYVEWTILAFYYLLLLTTPYAQLKSPKILVLVSLIALSVLSLTFPIDRPQWQCRIYVRVELIPLLFARSGGWSLDLLFYLFILKICLLFDRRETIIATVAIGIGWIVPLIWLIPNNDYVRPRELISIDYNHLFYYYFSDILSYIVINIFVLLFELLMIKESKKSTANQAFESRSRKLRNISRTHPNC
jgi:hypothetical protein